MPSTRAIRPPRQTKGPPLLVRQLLQPLLPFQVLTSAADSTNASSYLTASIAPAPNSRLVIFVTNSENAFAASPTMSGLGLGTFQKWAEQAYFSTAVPLGRLTAFVVLTGPAPVPGQLTIDFAGATQTGCTWSVIQILGFRVATPGRRVHLRRLRDDFGLGVAAGTSRGGLRRPRGLRRSERRGQHHPERHGDLDRLGVPQRPDPRVRSHRCMGTADQAVTLSNARLAGIIIEFGSRTLDNPPAPAVPQRRVAMGRRPRPGPPVLVRQAYTSTNAPVGGTTFPQSIDALVTFTPIIIRQTGKTLPVATSWPAAMVRSVGKPLTVATSWTAAMVRQTGKKLAVSTSWTVSMIRQTAKTLAVSTSWTAALVTAKVKLLVMAVTVTFTAAMTRSVGKVLALSAAWTVSLTKSVTKRLAVATSWTAAFVRQTAKTLPVSTAWTAALTKTKVILKALAVTVTFTAGMARQIGKLLPVSSAWGVVLGAISSAIRVILGDRASFARGPDEGGTASGPDEAGTAGGPESDGSIVTGDASFKSSGRE